jgi:hypothetical protein
MRQIILVDEQRHRPLLGMGMAPLLGKRPRRHQNFALKQLLDGVEGEQVKASLRKQDGGQFTTASLSSIMSRIRALVLLEGHRSTDYHMSSLWLRRLAEDKAECREFFHLSLEQQSRL